MTTNTTHLKYKPPGDCIFIHIPKTAGISIYESVLDLERHFDWYSGVDKQEVIKQMNKLMKKQMKKQMKNKPSKKALNEMLTQSSIEKTWPGHGAMLLGHISFQSLLDGGHLSQEYFDHAFKFAFVRNPYDRLISLYKYHQIETRLGLNFDAFVLVLSQEFSKGKVPPVGLYNIQSFEKNSKLFDLQVYGNQYNPMVDWIPKEHVMICYLETFEQDMNKLLYLMGYEGKPITIPKMNESRVKKGTELTFSDYYKNRQTIDLVNNIYIRDFDTFGYDMM